MIRPILEPVLDPEYGLEIGRAPGCLVLAEESLESFPGFRRGAVFAPRRVVGELP